MSERQPFLAVVDTETNGLDRGSDIIEIAVITLHPATLQTVSEFHSLIRPTAMDSAGRSDLHKIKLHMLADAPYFGQIAKRLQEEIDGKVLVGHNLKFDAMMLEENFRICGAEMSRGQGFCTWHLTGKKLNVAARDFSLRHTHPHAALSDARIAASLLRLRVASLEGQRVETAAVSVPKPEPAAEPKQRAGVPCLEVKPASEQQKRTLSEVMDTASIQGFASLVSSMDSSEAEHLIRGLRTPASPLSKPFYGGPEPATERQKSYAVALMEEHGVHGISVDRLTKTEISQLIDQLKSDPESLRSIRTAGRTSGCFTFQSLIGTAASAIAAVFRRR